MRQSRRVVPLWRSVPVRRVAGRLIDAAEPVTRCLGTLQSCGTRLWMVMRTTRFH